MCGLRTAAVSGALVALVAAVPAVAAQQYDFDLVSANGTITTSISGTWDNPNHALFNPDTGEDYPDTASATVSSTVRWRARARRLGVSFPLQAIGRARARLPWTFPVRGVAGSAQGTLNATLGDGSTRSCAPSGIPLNRAFFSDSAGKDLFLAVYGRGTLRMYTRGAYPFHAFSRDETCSEGLGGLSVSDTKVTRAAIPARMITRAKKGKRITLVVTHRQTVTGRKQGGGEVNVGKVIWRTALVLRLATVS